MKNILIINGHPNKDSLCTSLAEKYFEGALESKAICSLVHLGNLEFNPILNFGYQKRTELEPDLLEVWDKIQKADHLVFVYPNWWGTYPALLKGFFDRLFLPGFAFGYRENSIFIDKLLKGKSARVIVTMDSPSIYYNYFLMQAGNSTMKRSILQFCGITPVKFKTFHGIRTSSLEKRNKWLNTAYNMGLNLK